jgi:hypothetical protein
MTLPTAAAKIAAQAFRFMELSPISSFADDTPQAQAAAEQYSLALRMVLEASDWSFASRRAALPQAVLPVTEAADPDLPFTYRLPGDAVMMREVIDQSVAWRADLQFLRADAAGPLDVRYTALITNEAALPATVQTVIALQLALLLAPLYVSTLSKRQELEKAYTKLVLQARQTDGRQASPRRGMRGTSDDWVDVATSGNTGLIL